MSPDSVLSRPEDSVQSMPADAIQSMPTTTAGSAPKAFDVAVIGGGPAGLAAAVALARSLRSVVIIDAGQPRNAPAAHAHNVLGNEGINPRELIAKGRTEAKGYGVAFIDASVTNASVTNASVTDAAVTDASAAGETDNEGGTHLAEATPPHRFELATSSGMHVKARRVVIATGLSDELPDIPGLAEEWGDTVLHCPYCHGFEVRGQRIGIIGMTAMSYHQAMLFSQLSDRVTFVRHNAPAPDAQQQAMLETLGIEFIDSTITEVARTEGETIVSLAPGSDRATNGPTAADDATDELIVDALAVGAYARANAELFAQLGGEAIDHPSGMGSYIPTHMAGQTDVPSVWSVGNSADMSAMVVASAASGLLAGAHINADLIMERLG